MGERNRWLLIWELKQSLARVKQQSRLAQGQHFQPGSECVSVQAHTFTHTRIRHHMRIHPPDLAALFPSSGRWGISFLAMCCFLASERLYSFLLEGAMMGKCLHHSSPTCLLLNVSPLYLSSLFPSSCISLCLALSLSLSPSICYPPWADICCQAALLFCSSGFWLGFPLFLSVSVPLPLFVCLFFLQPSLPTNNSVQ